ncbi:hypothetical protein GF356_10000 [candidate division GN15 bacterium]|nr:hypothetical protein [candidate division GN15 bacterium]
MPFCPQCRFEYNPDKKTCPDCEVALVESLPEAEELVTKYDNWVALARLTSHQYAEMIQDSLRDKDIPVVVHSGTGHFGVTGQMGPSSFRPIGGGYTVHVPTEFVVEADTIGSAMFGDDWKKGRLVDIDESDH